MEVRSFSPPYLKWVVNRKMISKVIKLKLVELKYHAQSYVRKQASIMSADITEMTRRARRRPFQLRFETCDEAFICNIRINLILNGA